MLSVVLDGINCISTCNISKERIFHIESNFKQKQYDLFEEFFLTRLEILSRPKAPQRLKENTLIFY